MSDHDLSAPKTGFEFVLDLISKGKMRMLLTSTSRPFEIRVQISKTIGPKDVSYTSTTTVKNFEGQIKDILDSAINSFNKES